MELLTAFAPRTFDFIREPIDQSQVVSKPQYTASNAADVLTSAAMSSRSKALENGIYGSVSTSDVVASIKAALAHNDEAARVVISEENITFPGVDAGGDATRLKQLGSFKVEIKVPGADSSITRTVRTRAKESSQ